MSLETQHELPYPVQVAYDIDNRSTVTRLSGGLVNETLLVESDERSLILRRLAPILGKHTIRTIHAVGNHLSSKGWEAPSIQPTNNGSLYIHDQEQRMWHAMPNINSDCAVPDSPDITLAEHVGELLGNWHHTVSTLDFEPESLPYFHDIDYIAKKLDTDALLLESEESQELARIFLGEYQMQNYSTSEKRQIIHGDPKLDNMLFREGRPFTLIDLDCVMVDTVWTDIGDFLRSLSGKLVGTGNDPYDAINSFVNGYMDTAGIDMSYDEARYHALHATSRIACELGMRYLSDIVDGLNYFGWDSRKFTTRADALFSKAQTQFQIIQITRNYLNEGVR